MHSLCWKAQLWRGPQPHSLLAQCHLSPGSCALSQGWGDLFTLLMAAATSSGLTACGTRAHLCPLPTCRFTVPATRQQVPHSTQCAPVERGWDSDIICSIFVIFLFCSSCLKRCWFWPGGPAAYSHQVKPTAFLLCVWFVLFGCVFLLCVPKPFHFKALSVS